MPALEPDVVEVLAAALRSRATDRDGLAELLGRPRADIDRAVEVLDAAGFLTETAGVITYRRPDVAAAGLAAATMQAAQAEFTSAVHDANSMLGALHGLMRAWEMGDSDAHALPIDVLHGPWAPADMWRLQYAKGIPRTSDVCMPDTSPMAHVLPEHQASFWQARAGEPLRVRLIMSVRDATDEALRGRIESELAAGVRIRMHPSPPSWFWITDHDTIGVPLRWGEEWPSSVMAIASTALAGVLTSVFERVWQESLPVLVEHEHPWDALLRLLDLGMTVDAASAAIGVAPRTGRRRVADAMAHYGVSSLFALGGAWRSRR